MRKGREKKRGGEIERIGVQETIRLYNDMRPYRTTFICLCRRQLRAGRYKSPIGTL